MTVFSQYYDWGQDPYSIKWSTVSDEHHKFVFPTAYRSHAVRLIHYMDTVRTQIGFGYKYGAMRTPVVLHSRNFIPNGIVMQAPRRIELIVTPPASTYATPWLKQLAVHEYRHAVHFNNVNRNFIKVLGILLGQQGELVGAGFLPQWAMEGDAVLAETQMTSFGRGLQPSFTIDYRAMREIEGSDRWATDKLFSGSYRHNIPGHYHLGYQIASWAYTKYGENVFDKVAQYGSKYPFLIFTSPIALKKYYATSPAKLMRESMADLNRHWNALPRLANSAEIIDTPVTSFTTYTSPVIIDDTTIVAIKSDFDRRSRIVAVDRRTGAEKVIHRTGYINTGLSYAGGRLWWTEYRQSMFWEQRVDSNPVWLEIGQGGKVSAGVEKSDGRVMFTAAMDDGGYAAVEYDYPGFYTIKYGNWRLRLPDTISVHGFGYDGTTCRFYFIGLSDGGMWIGSAAEGDGDFTLETTPSYSTLANLRAGNGRLYFNSIASGRDEVHMLDLADSRQYRVTSSEYGSFEPSSPSPDGTVALTVYTPDGYLLATQETEGKGLEELKHSLLPKNVLNPERAKWDVLNIDNITIADTTALPVKKYRKGLNLFQFHSWAPVYFDPLELAGETSPHVNFGATLLSQNMLNSVVTTLGYRYTDEGHFVKGRMRFNALAPKFDIEAEYGSMNQLVYSSQDFPLPTGTSLNNHFSLTATVSLPMLLSSGHHVRYLTPSVEFEHNNAKLLYLKPDSYKFRNGMQKVTASIQFIDNVRMAYRDFLPRWGYALRLSTTGNPFNEHVNDIYSAFGRVYLPGVALHHSLTLRGAVQRSTHEMYSYRQKELFPRGARYNVHPADYYSASADYQFPLCYPDGGIPSILYFKRIRINLMGDYARYREFESQDGEVVRSDKWRDITSYGIGVYLDVAPLRMPSNTNTTITLNLYKPSNRSGVVFSAGLSLPL